MNIRQMTAADIPAVLEIDKASFSKPWNEKDFSDELSKDYSYYCLIEDNGAAIGYAGIWCIYETAELIRIAVSPTARRTGAGSALMGDILQRAKNSGCLNMLLEVRSKNSGARALYEKYGFNQIDLRRGYYGDDSAVIMERTII
jgi:ribosomal-protein-alanine N-acetyltransferase